MFSHVYVSLHSHALALDENDSLPREDSSGRSTRILSQLTCRKLGGKCVKKKMSQEPWVEGERYFIINALQTPLPY